MSEDRIPPACENPHHDRLAGIAVEAEVASWRLRGLAVLIAGLDGLHEHSTYPRRDEMGACMILCDALHALADKLEPPAPEAAPEDGTDPDAARPDLAVVDGGKPA